MWNASDRVVAGTSRSTVSRRGASCCGSRGMGWGVTVRSASGANHFSARSSMRSSSKSAETDRMAFEGW